MRISPLAIFLVLTAIISIQTGASMAKQLFPIVGAAGTTTLRIVLATVILFAVFRPWKTRLNRDEMKNIGLYGIALAFMNLFFYQALERIPLGITVALEFTGPLAVALLNSRRKLDFLWAVLAFTGILLTLPPPQTSESVNFLGVLFALGAGACWAFYIVFGQRAGNSTHGGTVTSLGMLIAALIVIPFGISQAGMHLFQLNLLPLALLVALLSSALPYSLEMIALQKIPKQTFGILMSLEPAIAALSGLIFLGEYLSSVQWFAIACIITASLGSSYEGKEKGNKRSKIN